MRFGNVLGSDRKILKSRSGEPMKFASLLHEAIERAGNAVAEKNPDLTADILHAGDSRVYHFRGPEMLYRTLDHSFVQRLVNEYGARIVPDSVRPLER